MRLAEKIVNKEAIFMSMAEKRRMITYQKDHLIHASEKAKKDIHVTKEALKMLGVSVEEIEKLEA
jgi:hypothetical protein